MGIRPSFFLTELQPSRGTSSYWQFALVAVPPGPIDSSDWQKIGRRGELPTVRRCDATARATNWSYCIRLWPLPPSCTELRLPHDAITSFPCSDTKQIVSPSCTYSSTIHHLSAVGHQQSVITDTERGLWPLHNTQVIYPEQPQLLPVSSATAPSCSVLRALLCAYEYEHCSSVFSCTVFQQALALRRGNCAPLVALGYDTKQQGPLGIAMTATEMIRHLGLGPAGAWACLVELARQPLHACGLAGNPAAPMRDRGRIDGCEYEDVK
ncbi:hypothetical protein V8C34DRAFT_319891 [Trichoderma compactum]